MTNLGLTTLLHIAMMATGAETYADAHRVTAETGRPMVVMVGADWCPACNVMKNTIMPQVRQRGLLRRVAFAAVNLDLERELGSQLTQNGPIPQLIMYRRAPDGWRIRRLVGGQDVQTIETFIQEGLQAEQASKPAKAPQAPPQQAGDVDPPSQHTAAHAEPGTEG